jgi:hypothetical protein
MTRHTATLKVRLARGHTFHDLVHNTGMDWADWDDDRDYETTVRFISTERPTGKATGPQTVTCLVSYTEDPPDTWSWIEPWVEVVSCKVVSADRRAA